VSEAVVAEPANPALAALFQTTAIDKWDAALTALIDDPPDVAAAVEHLQDSRSAMFSLAGAYESSDPHLSSDLKRAGNGVAIYKAHIEPYVFGVASLPEVAQAMFDSNFRLLAEGIRDRLH
jgi:hypothetical protein